MMVQTTVICSLYIYTGDEARKKITQDWYEGIIKTAGEDFKLLMIDDSSDEDVSEIIKFIQPRGYCKEVTFLKSNKREGKAIKLNQLIQRVDTRFVAVVDNDISLPDTWLTRCVHLASFDKIAVCGVLVQDKLKGGDTYTILDDPEHEGAVFHLPMYLGGACLVWEKKKLNDHGYFEESFGLYGHEDNEFLIRVNAVIGCIAALTIRGSHIESPDDSPKYKLWKKLQHDKGSLQALKVIDGHRKTITDEGQEGSDRWLQT